MARQKKILVVSDAAYPLGTTGFGIAAGQVLNGFLDAGFKVAHFARGLKAEPKLDPKFMVYAPPLNDQNGVAFLSTICEWERPDLIFMLADPGSIKAWRGNVEVRRVPNLVYTPTEGGPLCEPWSTTLFEIIDMGGIVTTYTEFSKRVILDEFPGKPRRDIEVLGHGVDHAPFRRYDETERADIRKRLGWQDKFVVIDVARNAQRKMLPRLMQACRLAKKNVPNLHLHLHTAAFEQYNLGGWNLMELTRKYKMTDYLSFHFEIKDGGLGISYDGWGQGAQKLGLIDLYNAADVFVSVSGGEGWNLPQCEAAACGVPVVAPMYSGGWEVVQNVAIGLPVEYPDDFETISNGLEMALVRPTKLAYVLEELANNWKVSDWKRLQAKTHSYAQNWKWGPTAARLAELAQELCG